MDTRFRSLVCVLLGLAALATHALPAAGSDMPSVVLLGRHAITVHASLLNHPRVEANFSPGASETRVSAAGGWLSYGYWPTAEWAMRIAVGALDVETLSNMQAGAITSRSAVVTSLLFGARYYPAQLALGPTGRPFVDLAAGPHVGSATNTIVGQSFQAEHVSETVFGGRAQVGMDWFAGRHFRSEMAFGYHWTAEFQDPIGRGKDYSGPEFMVGLGVMLGAGGAQ